MKLEHQDLIDGLREVVQAARDEGITGVSIRIIGGAALRLAYFERETTADIDAQIEPLAELAPIIESIASRRGWSRDWLNAKAVGYIPNWGRGVEWRSLLDDENVSIAVAPVDALLAMKLNAARPGRDIDDIAKLLTINKIRSVEHAEELFESFYPGEVLPDRTLQTVARIFSLGLPDEDPVPQAPDLSN
jgi:hypothetical protein